MKTILSVMLAAVCAAFLAQPLCAQDDALPKAEQAKMQREEKKLAADWIKSEMNNLRKTNSLIKKIKDEKSGKKILIKLREIYGTSGTQTAMGATGPATKPEGEAYKEQEKKNALAMTKLKTNLKQEIERISELELENDELMSLLFEIQDIYLLNNEDIEEEEEE